jgi:aerobic carbon-monoxide dehydrogenase medium subunit
MAARDEIDMKPAPFKYIEAENEATVVWALSQHGSDARLLAGGQSLVPMMNFRIATPAVLIDLNPVHALSYIRLDGSNLKVGAMTRHAMLEDSSEVEKCCPLLHDAIKNVAHRAVRNRGTFGGSLALAYPGAEIPLIMIALEAEVCLKSADGERLMPVDRFVKGALDTALADDEYIESARIRLPPASSCSSFVEVSRRHGDFAIAAAAVAVDLDQAGKVSYLRVALSGGTGAPARLGGLESVLIGVAPSTVALPDLTAEAVAALEVFGDQHYPEDYRRTLLRTAVLRALRDAFEKAGRRRVQ